MNDLLDRLSALSPEAVTPDEATIAADLRRGRRARRRHRTVRGITGGALALAVAGTVVAVHGGGTVAPTSNAPQAGAAGPDTSSAGGSGIQLVDYTGPQQAGFTVRTVPAGFVLQGVQPTVLDITRPGDTTSLNSFVGKVVVMLQSSDASFQRVGTKVSVNGRPGYIHGDPSTDSARAGDELGTATTLEYLDAQGHDVIVQAWDDLGLTDAQLVQLAEGVTVTAKAEAPVG